MARKHSRGQRKPVQSDIIEGDIVEMDGRWWQVRDGHWQAIEPTTAQRARGKRLEGSSANAAPKPHVREKFEGVIGNPEIDLSEDEQVTSDPLWRQLATFRRRLMEGPDGTAKDWMALLLNIRKVAKRGGHHRLKIMLGQSKHRSTHREPAASKGDSYGVCLITPQSDDGDVTIFVIEVSEGFGSRALRISSIEWAESWMYERAEELAASEASQVKQKPKKERNHKPDGWTQSELVSQAREVVPDFSNATFSRIRDDAKVSRSPKGGKGAQRRYSQHEVRKLIAAIKNSRRRHKDEIAAAWQELLPL